MTRSRAVLAAALFATLAFPGVGLAQESPAPTGEESPIGVTISEYQAYVQPSIVYLDLTWTAWVYDKYNKGYLKDGKSFTLQSSCTGFVVNEDGHIATAGHCIDKAAMLPDFLDAASAWAARCRCYYADETLSFNEIRGFADDDYRVEGEKKGAGGAYTNGADLQVQAVWSTTSTEPLYDRYGDLNGSPHEARVVDLLPWNEGAGDVGLVKVEGVKLPALPVLNESVETGTDVVSIGYPAVVGEVSDASLSDPSFKEGSISSVRTNATYPVYEMSASMSGGMSGGPTVNVDGEVVGVNSYGLASGESVFEFSQSSETLASLMIDAGVENDLGQLGGAYRAGLDAYFAGDKETAIQQLSSVVALSPDFDMAQQFLALSQQLPDPTPAPESTGSATVPVAAFVLGALALLGLAFVAFRFQRNRKRPSRRDGESVQLPMPPEPEVPQLRTVHEAQNGSTGGTDGANGGWFCTNCGLHMESADAQYCARCGRARDKALTV